MNTDRHILPSVRTLFGWLLPLTPAEGDNPREMDPVLWLEISREMEPRVFAHNVLSFLEVHPDFTPKQLHQMSNHIARMADRIEREVR